MLDVRPGLIFGQLDADDDSAALDDAHGIATCMSASRLRHASKKALLTRLSLDRPPSATPVFVVVAFEKKDGYEDYDVFVAQLELVFRFKHTKTTDGGALETVVEDLALVRWMDNAPVQENLCDLAVHVDKIDPRECAHMAQR